MKEPGYNMFNLSDKFYQDICTPYKTEGNIDITLTDRKDYKLNKKKKNTTKNNNKKEEEISITKKINESRIIEIENLLNSGNNYDKIKEYITQFEKDLEEKENLIRELFFQEYIIEENYEAYRE